MPYSSLLETFLGSGNVADLPVAATIEPTVPPGWVALWFAKDTGGLYGIANGDVAWTALAGGSAAALSVSTAVSTVDSNQNTSLSQISSSLSGTISTNVLQSTSLSLVSSSLSGAISSTTSLSTAVSTVISGSISTVTSSITSLSTAVGWTLLSTATLGGAVASVDFTGITGTEILVECRNVTQSVSGLLGIQVSVDNGGSFYSASGDYVITSTAGVESNNSLFGVFHITGATAARSGVIHLPASGANGGPKASDCITAGAGQDRLFVASTLPINALRILGSAGGLAGAGTIYCYTR